MEQIIERLKQLERSASNVQANAYHLAPQPYGCPKGHMGISGTLGNDSRTYEQQANDYITAISQLLEEAAKDQDSAMQILIEKNKQTVAINGRCVGISAPDLYIQKKCVCTECPRRPKMHIYNPDACPMSALEIMKCFTELISRKEDQL